MPGRGNARSYGYTGFADTLPGNTVTQTVLTDPRGTRRPTASTPPASPCSRRTPWGSRR